MKMCYFCEVKDLETHIIHLDTLTKMADKLSCDDDYKGQMIMLTALIRDEFLRLQEAYYGYDITQKKEEKEAA